MLTLYLARATPAAGGLVRCMRGDGSGPHTAHISCRAAAADKAAHACRRILRAAGAAVLRVLHDKRAAGYDAGKRGRRRRLGSRRHHVLCGAAALCCSGLGGGHGRARSIWRGLWRRAGTPHAGARLDAGRPQPPGWRRRLLDCSDEVGWALVLDSRRCHTEHVGICSSCLGGKSVNDIMPPTKEGGGLFDTYETEIHLLRVFGCRLCLLFRRRRGSRRIAIFCGAAGPMHLHAKLYL